MIPLSKETEMMTSKIYFDDWENDKLDGLLSDFQIKPEILFGCTIIFASYTYEDYYGEALVLFEKGGKLYRGGGSHCSCYGLEEQWEPEEVDPKAFLHTLEKGVWDDDSIEKLHSEILKAIARGFTTLPYDPTQQGDREDDI
jgi:hypothetical protein